MEREQGIKAVERIVDELIDLLDELDTVSCGLYPKSSDAGALTLDTAYLRIRDQKDELKHFIDEAKKGRI